MPEDSPRPATAREIVATLSGASLDEARRLVERYAEDPRKQVRHAVAVARRRVEREEAERARVEAMYALQEELGGPGVVVGVDEVGRGALAGPLTVAAVCLPAEPIAIGIAHVEPAVIDSVGMGSALRQAMASAVEETGLEPDRVLIDGNPIGAHPAELCIVKGDARIACIAAASIVAKVTRDALMVSYEDEYPGYHLAECKGYGSAAHVSAIRERGLTPIHRRSFCGNFVEQPRLF